MAQIGGGCWGMEGEKPWGLREVSTEGCSPQAQRAQQLEQQAGGGMKEKKKGKEKKRGGKKKKRTSCAMVNGVESLLKEPCLSH